MRILVISNLYPPYVLGGYEILCDQVCRELCRRGHEVVVLTSRYGLDGDAPAGDAPELPPSLQVYRTLRLYLSFDRPPRLLRRRRWLIGKYNYRQTRACVKRVHPEIIFIWSQLRLTVGPARAAQASGRPVVYTFNDENITGYLPARFRPTLRGVAAYILDHWVIPSITLKGLVFDHVTCISQCVKQNVIAQGLPIPHARVIYQGIPLEQFPPKADMGSIHHPARLLYVGQLHPYKGVHTLIEAAHRIAERSTGDAHVAPVRFSVTIIGDGPDAYKRRLADLATQGPAVIEFKGKVPHTELPPLYREHDLFVFPSIWREAFGLTHLEAMASGVPVISTANGGQGEFLRHGENALVFQPENAHQLAEHIGRLLRDYALRRRLAERARALVERQFTLERYVSELEAFLQERVAATRSERARGFLPYAMTPSG